MGQQAQDPNGQQMFNNQNGFSGGFGGMGQVNSVISQQQDYNNNNNAGQNVISVTIKPKNEIISITMQDQSLDNQQTVKTACDMLNQNPAQGLEII